MISVEIPNVVSVFQLAPDGYNTSINNLRWNVMISLVLWLALNPNVKLLANENYDTKKI